MTESKRVTVQLIAPTRIAGAMYEAGDSVEVFPFQERDLIAGGYVKGTEVITDYAQTLAEVWYWREVDKGELHLIHEEDAEAFYTPAGELALSRERVDLRHLFDGIAARERSEEGGGA